jgi:hypothetical protein
MQCLADRCNALAIDAVHYVDTVLPEALVPCLPTQPAQRTAYEKGSALPTDAADASHCLREGSALPTDAVHGYLRQQLPTDAIGTVHCL